MRLVEVLAAGVALRIVERRRGLRIVLGDRVAAARRIVERTARRAGWWCLVVAEIELRGEVVCGCGCGLRLVAIRCIALAVGVQ